MIENIKNDDLSVFCNVPKTKKIELISNIINELSINYNLLYIDYEINDKEINDSILKNKKTKIITKKFISNEDLLNEINENYNFVIINYVNKINNENPFYESLQNNAQKHKNKIIIFSNMKV